MPDEKAKKQAGRAKAQANRDTAVVRRADAAHFPGSSVHASLASEIGLRIVRGDYPPGSILPNEAKWAETFNVSRSAVREAIKMLMAKSLLASRPKIGSWVEPKERWNLLDRDVLAWYATAPDREAFLRTVQEFRHIIEPEASAFAAMRRSDEEMAEISLACREMGEAANLAERIRADTRFHLAILRASGNDLLVPLGVLIESALDHLFAFTTRQVGDQRRAQNLHEAIEKSIRLQRPAAARNAVHKLLADTDEGIGRGRR
ncbi:MULTISPECIES: FadR/GntR family transcriptional regulator [unclassified Mesorhizobium]|uniref:FadR/GntR family transcriptional regulator n=1 Tax=unclassified Mesorhizobium TaxID=325217 RepID=UPI000FCC5EFD|nr:MULTISPECIES: FadR/GntR family transcriptional regulator [unclassified Mesorhizobium]RUW98346.1 FadR family transcriptional regulator [Mesorhizobium sp. M8A.F.Ca.ET.059.01.1.1]TGR37650.1 FadR family transcriptional regulator [bacterium M00.F.Ca.ET.199.01.1.1]TGU22632.1 FadR family transcriptional regulator [bacterium M00.F.Ca.ET.156.01.1.1]TGV51667.1 FadR family transcriptional regulator [bacterium M00.F.Ca.ET.141.01.1.1]TGV82841.1 FadR family transcriptional regulator [Mesorhizobium sp. M0